ncbi:MAG: FtsX-like permease family protein [Caldilineaceae bacterium]
MAFSKLWVIAFRDLGRNRRRTLLSFLAVALGLMLLMLLNGLIAGVMDDALQNSIRLRTGHVQLRAKSYAEEKLSLQWKDLLTNVDDLTKRAQALPEVKAAAPVLWAGAVLNTSDEAVGLQLIGIDPTSAIYAPIQSTVVAGDFLTADDRGGVLLGKRLADSLGLAVGQKVNVSIINADGQLDEADFTIRGLFASGALSYDESAILLPLARAQAFTQTAGHASALVLLLNQQTDADKVAAALQGPDTVALTWQSLNQVFLQTMQTAMGFYTVLDGIVMLVVAVIIANTLLMAVFERIREMGILAALGMKGRQIMQMFLFEAAILGLVGIAVGLVLGAAGVLWLARVGIPLSDAAASSTNIALSGVMHAQFVPTTFAWLALWTLVITLLAALYPAWFAARLEPVEALHGK